MTEPYDPKKCYWVVSPNVRNNNAKASEWRQTIVLARAAFMGYEPNESESKKLGPKFAGKAEPGIKPGDVILIARRYHSKPEIVGFGEVIGKAVKSIPGVKAPEEFGSARLLKPFVPWTGMPPLGVPIKTVIGHTYALAELHPDRIDAHKKVCGWLDEVLNRKSAPKKRSRRVPRHTPKTPTTEFRIVASPKNHQLDYKIQTQSRVLKAKKFEARLLEDYKAFIAQQGRELSVFGLKRFQCDAYEADRKNLIEAKASTRRELIRMAVGQLLDYAYQGRKKLGSVNMAVLLPDRPSSDIMEWLDFLKIKIVWREKSTFLDNAGGKFT